MSNQLPNLRSNPSSNRQVEPVYIIIPVYNRKDTTLACIAHLEAIGDLARYHVVIVDDGSTDGTAEAIAQAYPDYAQIHVLPGDGDLWWTGAIAKGMTYAHDQGARFLIWLNDDSLPAKGTLARLLEFMRSHPDTIAAPSCYAGEAKLENLQHNGFRGREGFAAKPGELLPVEGLSGWCVGMPIAVYDKIGAPNAQKFPHYAGDDVYTFQATKAGFKAFLLGDLTVELIGPVHAKLGFEDYFKPGSSAGAIFHNLFWHKKSPYRLPTRYFFFQERYGLWVGAALFATKLSFWLFRWAQLQLLLSLKIKS
ncbi:glycosyl transferase family 2 [Thalassoporum mexicanum PCC 7367]|uniref:glycosyltransferase family 2 protein n=1 Tax=Thalassoporum mexicanum TaxID=3457544 RepID=UPI00029F90E9|nr:glycosyltransferase family 2 protein [Pseudanabaena sp. PCC 7367]AFY71010.1 glycosyl transferase family 2 [Pseudanabaena sp. PCC 7367]